MDYVYDKKYPFEEVYYHGNYTSKINKIIYIPFKKAVLENSGSFDRSKLTAYNTFKFKQIDPDKLIVELLIFCTQEHIIKSISIINYN